jgi:hypothetical protein
MNPSETWQLHYQSTSGSYDPPHQENRAGVEAQIVCVSVDADKTNMKWQRANGTSVLAGVKGKVSTPMAKLMESSGLQRKNRNRTNGPHPS